MGNRVFISSKVKLKFKKNTAAVWRERKPHAYQTNILQAIRCLLDNNRCCSRKTLYETIYNRWHLEVRVARHYADGGVGSWSWLPRKGCIRLQVGASRIDPRKHCWRYAPVVDIYDDWHNA